MKTPVLVRRLSRKKFKNGQEIEVTIEFRGIRPHRMPMQNEIASAVTALMAQWYPADHAQVRVNLNYRTLR